MLLHNDDNNNKNAFWYDYAVPELKVTGNRTEKERNVSRNDDDDDDSKL